jgi:NADH dehydrogenase FAD-containing subunit
LESVALALSVTEPLIDCGIEVADGVVVNERLETNQPDIYAAGDVASYYDVLFGKHRRAEHWDNAVSQGQYCARARHSCTFLISSPPFSISPMNSGETLRARNKLSNAETYRAAASASGGYGRGGSRQPSP